jgi:hypothetical protein
MLGDTDPEWEQRSSSITGGVSALLDSKREARQTTLLSYFENKSEEPPIDLKTAEDDLVDLPIHSQGIPLISNAYNINTCNNVCV